MLQEKGGVQQVEAIRCVFTLKFYFGYGVGGGTRAMVHGGGQRTALGFYPYTLYWFQGLSSGHEVYFVLTASSFPG